MNQKLLLLLWLCFITATTAWAQTATAPSAGSGTESDPYQIISLENLYWISQNQTSWNSYFEQTANIDASETSTWNEGAGFSPIGNSTTPFTGNYNGQGYTIDGLTINRSSTHYVGLFGSASGASIDSLGLTNVYIQGDAYVGGLVGSNSSTSQVNNSYSTGSVSGSSYAGGLIGSNFISSQVNNSYSTGLVSGDDRVGGLVGRNSSSSRVNNSYSTCSVSGDDLVGGLVGRNSSSSQVNISYSTGLVLGSYGVGGLVGSNYSATISDSYYNSETSGQSSGLGSDDNSQTVTVLTIAQMKQSSRFTGWDFENNWEITEGISFPRLIDVADAPVILPVFKKTAKVDVEYLDTIQVVTMDNSDVTLELLKSPDGMLVMQDSILSWTPTALGDYEVEIRVSDGDGLYAISNYTITVTSLSGQGTVSHPFKITSLDELRILSETSSLWDESYYFEQTAHIDASETRNWDDGAGFSPIGNSTTPFTGNYNGQGYTIDGLTINRSSTNYVGLFGSASGASIDSLGLTNVYIQGYYYVGGLVGFNSSTSQVNNSYSTGSVSGSSFAGGLIGYNSSSSQVNNSYSACSVSGYNYVGGLVGYNDSHSSVNNSYSTGSVSGDDRVGGLVGQNSDSSTIRDSYSTGSVSGSSGVGGLVGYNDYSSTISNSYYNSETSGQSSGLGYDNNSQTVTALTTAQMKQSSRFTGWDFENNWEITEGISFPRLINVADAPVILPVFKKTAKVDVEYLDTIQVVTMDNPDVSLELLQSPDGMSLVQDSILSWTPTASGDYEVEIMVSDGDGLYAISNYTITVTSLSGQGTVSDPFKITSLDELRMLSETSALWDKSFYFEQTANIDASETGTWNDGAGFSPIGNSTTRFTGNYNGKGYTIDGLIINRSSTYYVGLFGSASGASIDSLGLTNVDIQGYYYVGGLVGYNSLTSQVNNSYSTGSVFGYNNVGGLVGSNSSTSQVNNSYSTGSGSVSGSSSVGGLVGSNDSSSSVNNSYSTGSVSGSSGVGGLVGYNDYSSTISNSYYNSETSGQSSGLGYDNNSQTVTALTTAQMKQSSRFTGWDFENNWEITEGISFPRLINVADAPVILPVFKKVAKVNVEYLDTIQVVTMDNPDVTLELLQSPDGMSLLQDSILSWTPTVLGDYEVEIMVSDGDGLYAIPNYTITVTSLSGQGTVSNPIKITSLDELRILSETSSLWDKSFYFEQTANIDASETVTWSEGAGFSPIGNSTTPFTGNYNGQGYTIDGLTINRSSSVYVGLFGYASGATIDSLGLTNVDIHGENYVGGLVGHNFSTSQVNNSYSTGSVSGSYYVGGLIGLNFLSSQVNNSYSTSSVSGSFLVGGLVGYNDFYSSVNKCYSIGSVSGSSDVGGLVGSNYSSTISNSYYNSETSGQPSGLGSDDSNSQTVTALTTAQMKQSSRFTGWDFENNWEITEGISFPRLINVADAPVILPVFKKIAHVDVEYLDTIQVVTMDNPDVTLKLLKSPDGMLVMQDSILSWTPTASGDYEVEIRVSDGDGLYAISNYTITVTSLSGQGTVSDPFKITSLDELRILSETSSLWNKSFYFEQTANIDASDTRNWNEGVGFSPIGNSTTRFTGNYNGQGYTIDGLTINRSLTDYVGLFGSASGVSIDSLGLTNVYIQGYYYVGGLVGRNSLTSQVNNSYSTGSVSGRYSVGGLIGLNYSSSQVNNSYSTGSVSGSSSVGGLVGYNNSSSKVNNSYSIGSVSGSSDVGGLVGHNDYSSTISNSYYNSETSGQSSGLGYDGSNSQTVTALTTAQMKQSSRFTGWDFENNWEITEGISFPRLIDVADAPIILPVFKKVAKVNVEYLDTIQVVTMDNPDVTLELLQSPDGMSLLQDSILSWTPTLLGDYEVEIMVSDGEMLSNSMDMTIIVSQTVSIHSTEQNTTDINVYPNPATTVITVTGSTGIASLYNIDGTKVLVQDLSQSNRINISAFPSGVYMLSVDGSITKVIIQ